MEREREKRGARPLCRSEGQAVHCSGSWTLDHLDQLQACLSKVDWPVGTVQVRLEGVAALDSAGAWFLHRQLQRLRESGREVALEGLDERTGPLMAAMSRIGPLSGARIVRPEPGLLEGIGRLAVRHTREYVDYFAFLGALAKTAADLIRHPRRIRWRMLFHFMDTAGVKGLPIVGLLSFLLGVVIAYQGGVQLRQYGANIYIADLVGLAMARELAPLLTAIIIAGRTGSAYTAQIGTMKVTEEIDALRSIGIAPMELVGLPRVLALMLVLPLLTVFADAMGLLGGILIGTTVLGLSASSFIDRTADAVTVVSYLIGIGKAPVFAAIVATVGCFQGFQVDGSAESVGYRTTVSVVQAIFLVIIVDAAFSVLFSQLGL
jgi:phospholipid/cholesterol/gamma-HCH transport system permease protein